jgi:[ribosomal protein S18]-alanine N-acetyltransferase
MQIYNGTVQLTIRDFQSGDFDTLWRIDQSCFPGGISYTRFELQTYMRRPGAFTLVAEGDQSKSASGSGEQLLRAEDGVALVAFLVAERSRRGAGHIITIDVRAEWRRHRVGSRLLAAAEERLRSSACAAIQLETAVDNAAALCFYKRHGYSVIKTVPRYYSNGVDALVLEKMLLSPVSSR